MMHVLVRPPVAAVGGFDEWKSHFDEGDATRREHGQQSAQVFRSVDDPNEVVVLFEWDDEDNARAFHDSEERRERREAAGVEEHPDVTYLERVEHSP